MSKMITALYIRVSTDAQAEEGYSLEAQKERLLARCKSDDIENTEIYEDGGWSGKNIERPSIQRLITDILDGKVERVMVYKLDRLSRSQKDVLYLLEDIFEPNHVSFVSLNENFDTSTPYGKAMVGILAAFAQFERENIQMRTSMGMRERIKEGKWRGGGTLPFGYNYDANADMLVPNEYADDVRKIYNLYLEGYSTTQLAKMFPVSGDRQITQILSRITYLGKISHNGEVYEGLHEPLIDEYTWNKVQKRLEERSNKHISTSKHLLTGLMYCGKCGAKMRYQKWSKDKNGNIKYKIYCYSQDHSKTHLIKDPNCNNLRIEASDLEKIVLNDVFNMTDGYVAQEEKGFLKFTKESSMSVLLKKQDALSNQIKRLYDLYAKGENADEFLLNEIKEKKEEYIQVCQMIEKENAVLKTDKDFKIQNDMVKNLRNRWDSMNIKEKKAILNAVISRITINGEQVSIDYNI